MATGKVSRRDLLKSAAATGGALVISRAGRAASKPLGSSSLPSYALPSLSSGVELVPILTVGDAADNGYRFVGVADGLGVLRERNGRFSLFVNHEITSGSPGIVRAHGEDGAFVSKWTIDAQTLTALAGEDLTPSPGHVYLWDTASESYIQETTQWQRLCSADLSDEKALRHGNRGTSERIFFDGEEINFGRAWARFVTGPQAGEAWELPRLGKSAFENVVACPHGKDKTIIGLFDDGSIDVNAPAASNPSEVFVYVGNKQREGSELERAGLTNGKLYGLHVFRDGTLVAGEDNDFGIGDASTGFVGRGRFELLELGSAGDVSALSGVELETDAMSKNVFRMLRPEDGAWDPRGSGKESLFFVTTASIDPLRNSRLWKLTFDDLSHPERGGRIEILLTNTPGRMFDNITIDRLGRLLLQEDTGNNPWVSKIWLYSIDTDQLIEIVHHDPELFQPGLNPARFITQDEESSGIIDAHDVLGEGWFIFAIQVHKSNSDPELVEGGQLVAMYVDPRIGQKMENK